MRTAPVNQSDGPLPDTCEPTLLISIDFWLRTERCIQCCTTCSRIAVKRRWVRAATEMGQTPSPDLIGSRMRRVCGVEHARRKRQIQARHSLVMSVGLGWDKRGQAIVTF